MNLKNPIRSTVNTVAETVTIAIALVWGVATGFLLVLVGQGILYNQLATTSITSLTGAVLLIGLGITVACATLIAQIIGTALLSMADNYLNTDLIKNDGITGVGIVGTGGLIGTILAGLLTIAGWGTTNSPLLLEPVVSLAELTTGLLVVGGPVAYISHLMTQPVGTVPTTTDVEDTPADPKQEQATEEGERIRAAGRQTIDEYEGSITRPTTHTESTESPPQTGETGITPAELEFDWNPDNTVSFDDVGGMEDIKQELKADVIRPLTTDKKKAEKLGVGVRNIIFYGPPGTGKTYIAEALSSELDVPFVKLSGGDLQSKWVNESASKVNTLFREAKDVARSEGGAVVFIDELDSVLTERAGNKTHNEDAKVVNEFLNHLEDANDHNIVFIGATNRLDSLDEAGIRAGRIDKKIEVGKPDKETRKAILKAQLNDRPNNLDDKSISIISKETEGYVAAELTKIVDDAARNVLNREGDRIKMKDIREAVDAHNKRSKR